MVRLMRKFFGKWLAARRIVLPAEPAWRAIVAEARTPDWYLAGAVPDSIDGRFDMVALVASLVLVRAEALESDSQFQVALVERFVDDMDGSVRELGVGDMVVSKHIGRMTGALGGRLGAYRSALAEDAPEEALGDALLRNLYRGAHPGEAALAWAQARVRRLHGLLQTRTLADLEAGNLGV